MKKFQEIEKQLKFNYAMNAAHGNPNKLTEAFRIIKLPIEQVRLRASEVYQCPYRINQYKFPQEYIEYMEYIDKNKSDGISSQVTFKSQINKIKIKSKNFNLNSTKT